MKRIITGYQKFFKQYFEQQSFYQDLFVRQKPHTMFIACCDSRVDPALLVSAQPGDIFVERNVANVVPHQQDGPNSILIALEVALNRFDIKDIIIMGHECCTGVELLAQGALQTFGQVPVEYVARHDALKKIMQTEYSQTTACEFEKTNVILSCQNIMSHDLVKDVISRKKVSIHGWYFSLKTGTFETLCFTCYQFTDLMVECCGRKVI